jgi:hypothetical protein
MERPDPEFLTPNFTEALFPFVGNPGKDMPQGLPFQLNDYLELVDWSGHILREDKKGAIVDKLPGILQRLDMDAKQFIYLTRNFEHPFKKPGRCSTSCTQGV